MSFLKHWICRKKTLADNSKCQSLFSGCWMLMLLNVSFSASFGYSAPTLFHISTLHSKRDTWIVPFCSAQGILNWSHTIGCAVFSSSSVLFQNVQCYDKTRKKHYWFSLICQRRCLTYHPSWSTWANGQWEIREGLRVASASLEVCVFQIIQIISVTRSRQLSLNVMRFLARDLYIFAFYGVHCMPPKNNVHDCVAQKFLPHLHPPFVSRPLLSLLLGAWV